MEINKLLKLSKEKTAWDLGNNLLYQLCQEHPHHKTDEEIIAKIWLIGRSYAASIERRKIKDHLITDDFYLEKTLPIIRNSNIDDRLKSLVKDKSIKSILELHSWLTNLFFKISGLNKRSLASKYLHFHFPFVFFIYDSRAVNALGKLTKLLKLKKYKDINNINNVDEEYFKFFIKTQRVLEKIKNDYNIKLTPREFDNLLILLANETMRKTL